ncbi:hypothetical protein DFH28DRAFT_915190, partial [Melampsora americana]
QGYLGGSPTRPETAFSIRLIRTYHLQWKHRPIGVQPFALAHDEYLDAFCPLILVPGTNEPRRWRKPMACAVHAYRLILKARDDLEVRVLQLSNLQKMATLCPRCFGPGEPSQHPSEPDFIVSLDGNFQHKRHAAASREFDEIQVQYPSLFLTPEQVDKWAPGGGRPTVEIPLDPCTAQHTAAADRRCATTFRGFDDNGLMGMACRHDQFLSFINIVKSGENIFVAEREQNRLKFGTSVFHAYVHRWSCQLEYNPRLNEGWGLSDGEGLERDWSFLDALVALLRYVTKQHRLDALHFRALHRIFLGQTNIGRSIKDRVKKSCRTLEEAESLLVQLERVSGHNTDYFAQQWARQKTCQSETIGHTNLQHLETRLGRLIELEETFRESHTRLQQLQRQRRRTMSDEDFAELRSLPALLVTLGTSIEDMTVELGGPEFQDMEAATGASAQQRFKDVMKQRTSAVQRKWTTYEVQVQRFRNNFPDSPALPLPTLDEVLTMHIGDAFWNIGHLTHPDEPWAVDDVTQKGIEAFRTARSCKEELRRVVREVQNVVLHALEIEGKLNDLATLSNIGEAFHIIINDNTLYLC